MLFGRFYIKNNHTNYNSYFPLKFKCLTGKNIFIRAFGASVSSEIFLSQQVSVMSKTVISSDFLFKV